MTSSDTNSHSGDTLSRETEEGCIELDHQRASHTLPSGALIHEIFERRVLLAPDAIAAVYEEQSYTYAELNARANQLARYLRRKGVGADVLVGLCLERSLDMVVGLLAILKAGGAYLPLDPNYPSERLAYLLRDASPKVLLVHGRLRERLLNSTAEVIAIDEDWRVVVETCSCITNLGTTGTRPDHMAYVIYTSGSTGEPKGVMVEHRNVTRLFDATNEWFRFDEDDVWTLFHSIAFDFSVWELWGALLYGGRVVIVPYTTARSPRDFYRLLCTQRVTVLNQTPSAFRQVVDAQADGAIDHSLRIIIFGGEALDLRILQPWIERNGAKRPKLVNMYGITETTVHVTYRPLCEKDIVTAEASPIGKPIPDLCVYLLDGDRQPVPIGVPGEIYVSGAGVARGYLNRPELSAERFIRDPFSDRALGRMYKTGDLGKWRSDGSIDYLGRNDDQVKIRGFRIELGEIENQLRRHPAVNEAVVLAREDTPGEKQLVAYIAKRDRCETSTGALRAHLQAVLPDYMLPQFFVMLERIPLTEHGKLDRRALPAPDAASYVHRRYESPQGEIEQMLAGIWSDLLRVERVGRWDNFFELGGHSLLMVHVMDRLRRAGLSTEAATFFSRPTLASLAIALRSQVTEVCDVPLNLIPNNSDVITPQMLSLVQLQPEHIQAIVGAVPGGAKNIQDIYPLTPLQQGILFHHKLDEHRGDTYVLPVLLVISTKEKLRDFIEALQNVIDRHDALRTAIISEQLPHPVQVVYRRAVLPVHELTVDPIGDCIEQLKRYLMPESQKLDLCFAPPIRLKIAKDTHDGHWYALLQIHHLISDHVSVETMFSEVKTYIEGHAKDLLDPVPYRNHVWQVLKQEKTGDANVFFQRKLEDVDEPSAPFGLFDVHGGGSRLDVISRAVDPELLSRVRVRARRLGVSSATLFHAAWALVVAQTSGREDVVYGTVLLGRLNCESMARPALGLFINTLPLRLRLQGVTAAELVEQTQRELVELLEYEQASLAVAQSCSGVSGSVPLFSSLLNYLHSDLHLETAQPVITQGIQAIETREWTSYPITISIDDQDKEVILTAKTDRRIDARRMIEYLCTAMRSMLKALENGSETLVLALSVMPDAERYEIIHGFNRTKITCLRGELVHQLFEEQVRAAPHNTALICDSRTMTYEELNLRSNQLARYLRREGIALGSTVGICAERSVAMVLGLLAILKAGGAYVPLDPSNPSERLQYVLDDASPVLLLTQEKYRTCLPETRSKVIPLEMWTNGIVGEDSENIYDPRQMSEQLAYVMYTSGSTGRPKGVMVSHRNIVNYARYAVEEFDVALGEGSLVATSMCFDLSLTGLFPPLICGRTVTLCSNAEDLPKQIGQREFAPVKLTPTHLAMLSLSHEQMSSRVRTLVIGGEPLRGEVLRWWREHSPATRLFNHYGPTETTVGCLVHEIVDDLEGAVPIGRPIANTRVYVLNSQLSPVPIGVVGELYVAGAGVSVGYRSRPEQTAQRFLPNPFSTDFGARMYRTGDLVRWRMDGAVEYVARNDRQIKIRGFRVELGEIETQLVRHAKVKDAVVIGYEEVPGETRLVAYFIPKLAPAVEPPPRAEELRAHLKASLPDHMVPTAFVSIERLPITRNGKLDRSLLPRPAVETHTSPQFEAPVGETEEMMAAIWQELLRVPRVGRRDSFFELGGHSLVAMQLASRIGTLLAIEVPVRRIFENPTLHELSAYLGQLRDARLVEDIEGGGNSTGDLLERVVSMSQDEVAKLVGQLTGRETS